MTKKEIISEHFAKLGKKGGKAAANSLTSEERKSRAMKGVQARLQRKDLTKPLS